MSEMRVKDEVCVACDHSIHAHFENVMGIVRCLVTEHGTSSSGVIGMPYVQACDCRDYRSEIGDRRHKGNKAFPRDLEIEVKRAGFFAEPHSPEPTP